MLSSYEADSSQDSIDPGEVKGPDIPLMPQVLRIHFVSCATGEGIPNLRKVLYKVWGGEERRGEHRRSIPNCCIRYEREANYFPCYVGWKWFSLCPHIVLLSSLSSDAARCAWPVCPNREHA